MTEKPEETPIGNGEYILWGLALLTPMALFWGWSVKLLWSWFVVPLGVPPVNIFHAMGLYFTVRVVTAVFSVNHKKKLAHPFHLAIESLVSTLAILGVCALARLGV